MDMYNENNEWGEEMSVINTPEERIIEKVSNDENRKEAPVSELDISHFSKVDYYKHLMLLSLGDLFKDDKKDYLYYFTSIPYQHQQRKIQKQPSELNKNIGMVDADFESVDMDYEVVDDVPDKKSSTKKNKSNAIYQVHSDGHLIVISKYTKGSNGVNTCRASTQLLCDIICQRKQPVIINLDRLSNLQISEVRKALDTIRSQITVQQVCKHEKRVWVVKYKR